MLFSRFSLVCSLLLSVFVGTLSADEASQSKVAIICNANVPVSSLKADEIKNIFLGKTTKIADKGKDKVKVSVVTLKEGTPHDLFLKGFISKTSSQFNTFWKKLVFSGKAKMPKSFKTEKELAAYVAKTKGAIGYVHIDTSKDTSIITEKITIITVTK